VLYHIVISLRLERRKGFLFRKSNYYYHVHFAHSSLFKYWEVNLITGVVTTGQVFGNGAFCIIVLAIVAFNAFVLNDCYW
jgi:hypothetical protein